MAQSVRTRKQGTTVDYSANNKVTIGLARGMVYRELYIRLQGQLDCDATLNTLAKTKRGDEWAVIKKIELIANGTDVLRSFDANFLWWLNYFMYSAAPKITAVIGDASINPAFDVVLIIPLWMPKAVRPIDTALDSRELSSLELTITWGDHTSINASADGWTTEPTVEIYSLESFNISGPFSQWRIFTIEKEITATNTRFQVQLPVGKMYRGFILNTIDTLIDQGDILNNFKLVSGTSVFTDIHAQDDVLQQVGMLRNALQRHINGSVAASVYEGLRRSDESDLAGWYFYDHVTDGRLTEAIDTLGFSEFTIEANVTVGSGTTKLFVYPLEIVPIRGGANR